MFDASELWPLVLHLGPLKIEDDEFFLFCQANRELRLERTGKGELIVMPLADGVSGSRNAAIGCALREWAGRDRSGVSFSSTTGFILPNGAMRAPDASWVLRSRLAELTAHQKQKFLPLGPDFVVELRSPSDRLSDLQAKMDEYIANGARLGWLIDPISREVHVYRPGQAPAVLAGPAAISGDPVLPGFVLDLTLIWDPGF